MLHSSSKRTKNFLRRLSRIYLLLWFCSCLLAAGIAQNTGKNPFELTGRIEKLPETSTTDSLVAQPERTLSDTTLLYTSHNPFEILRGKGEKKTHRTPTESHEEKTTQILGKSNPLGSKELRSFLFWIYTGLFVYLAINLTLFRFFLARIYKAFVNDNFLKLLHRELKGGIIYPYWTFYLFFLFNGALFVFLYTKNAHIWEQFSDMRLLTYCFLGIFTIYSAKQMLLRVLAWIFPFGPVLRVQNFSILVFATILGLILFPLNTFIAFSPEPMPQTSLYLGLAAILLVYIYRYLRGIFSAARFILQYRFHFFMYLCTIEIAPALIIARILYDLTGV